MALFYPDILEHNNPANPLMDDGQLAGSLRIVADKTARNAIPTAKRKIGALVNWTELSQVIVKKYIGSDVTDPEWTDDANWADINHPFFSLNITQALTANSTTTFSVGSKLVFGTITINYQITRDTAVAMGTIQIVQNVSGLESPVFSTIREINSIGLVGITSAFNGDNIEVSIELDGSSATDGVMVYNLECYFATFPVIAWTIQTSPITSGYLYGVCGIDANNSWAVGYDDIGDPLILNTSDGGSNWVQQTHPVTFLGTIMSIHFIDLNNGWCCGYNSNLGVTSDGGSTWTAQTAPVSANYLCIFFANANDGWAVGEDGAGNMIIIHTSDGGTNWAQQTSPVIQGQLEGVFFTDSNNGWASGYDWLGNTLMLYTDDGGLNWGQQTLPSSDGGLLAVCFISPTVGWASGHDFSDNAIILHTTDGGTNWTPQTSPVAKAYLYSISFVDSNNGWIVGYDTFNNSVILVTTDAGVTWTQQTSPIEGYLECVSFANLSNGWAVGVDDLDNIIILKYSA